MNLTKQKGFTLTEIMVAVAIGLIGTIVIFKALQSTNIVARNTTGGADAATAGSIALYSIERDAVVAGYGINYSNLIGCKVLMRNPLMALPADIVANTATAGTAVFAPAIVIGADDTPTLRIAYAGGRGVVPTKLTKDQAGTSTESMRVINLYGLQEASTILMLGEANSASVLASPAPGQPCTIAQTSKTFSDPDDRDLMTTNGDKSPFSALSGSGQTYSTEGRVYNLGSLSAINSVLPANIPVWKEFRVDPATETLQEKNIFTSSTFTTIAPNVSAMYVDYVMRDGSTRSGFPILNPVGDTATDLPILRNVVGLRVSLLTRNALPDYSKGNDCKNLVDTNANTMVTPQNSQTLSTGFKNAAGNDVRFTLVRANNPNAFCYRYKTVSTTVMMRNMIWSS